jgi:hypothetical protein
MSQYLNSATVGAGTYNSILTIWDEERGYLYGPQFFWNYQQRNLGSAFQKFPPWIELWYSSQLSAGDPTQGFVSLGQDNAGLSGEWEIEPALSLGTYRPYFFRGTCTDQYSNPLGGAVIKAYLTATDQMVGQTATDSNGNYQCPSPYSGQNHYLVATIVSGNLAGVTVNTLQPSL